MGDTFSTDDAIDRVLLVLDDATQAESIERVLRAAGYHTTTCARDDVLGRPIKGGPFDLAIVDQRSLSGTPIDLIDWIKRHDPYNVILVLGGPGTPAEALRDMTYGGTFGVPRDVPAQGLLAIVAEALKAREKRWGHAGRPLRRAPVEAFDELVAESPAMRALLEQARSAARSERAVLILGESGTGKDRLARYVHLESARSRGRFMVVNAAAVPENMIEHELFGYWRSACWGPPPHRRLQPGQIQMAEHGTLFLDEFTDLTEPVFAKLLDAIDARSVVPVGGQTRIAVDARFILASYRDLPEEVAAGRLRREHYERLDAVELVVPPLRERREDVLPLAEHFLRRHAETYGRAPVPFSTEVAGLLQRHPWPGNVRELNSAVERALALTATSEIVVDDLPEAMRGA